MNQAPNLLTARIIYKCVIVLDHSLINKFLFGIATVKSVYKWVFDAEIKTLKVAAYINDIFTSSDGGLKFSFSANLLMLYLQFHFVQQALCFSDTIEVQNTQSNHVVYRFTVYCV